MINGSNYSLLGLQSGNAVASVVIASDLTYAHVKAGKGNDFAGLIPQCFDSTYWIYYGQNLRGYADKWMDTGIGC